MKVLLVSYYAERHLSSSSAQNTRLVAEALSEQGHAVRVVCAAAEAGDERLAAYGLTKLPLASPSWDARWLGAWRPHPGARDAARRILDDWRPDVVLVGAWKYLTEFAVEARRRRIPSVQIVHDYSLICLRQWLLDGSGRICTGPTSPAKCIDCLAGSLGPRAALANRLLSLPLAARLAASLLGEDFVDRRHVPSAAEDALAHMRGYRRAITLFVAQAPSVVELLGTAGIPPSRCRFLPQFIGDEKLERYPRPADPPGERRPLRLAYVGRWSREKGPDLLLEAFRTSQVSTDLELWILSGDARGSELERHTVDAGGRSKAVRVVNDARGGAVSRLLAQCDVCVVPSRCRELASRVVLEANAQGLPVVASSTVGNNYLVRHRENGLVFASGSVAALRSSIEEVAADPSRIRRWSARVAEPIRRQEWSRRVLEILEEAVRCQGPP